MRIVGSSVLLFFLAPLFMAFGAHGEDLKELAKMKPLSGRAFLVGSNKIKPGAQVELKIAIELMEQFKAYGDKFSLEFKQPKDTVNGELFIDPLVDFNDVVSKKKKRGVYKQATITTQVVLPNELPQGLEKIKMALTYIACTEKVCLLPKDLDLEIPVEVVVAAGADKPNFEKNIAQQIEGNFWFALLLIYFFGFLTSFTPCVYPLIPITLAVLGSDQKRSKSESFLISLSYVVGIAITYAILGVIAAQTGQLFGSFISHPAVIITTCLIFLAMGLSLFGLFELQPPAAIRNRFQNYQGGKGPFGAFVSGTLAGVIASPCVGPVLVGVLAYIAQSQDSLLGFVLLFTFAIGFGTLFLALGTFGQLAHKLPQSGQWMNRVKYLLGACMILLAVYYAMPLVKTLSPQNVIAKEGGVQWQKFSKGHVIKAKAEGRPVIIDFYADWCAACVELDQFTFTDNRVIERSKDFLMLKVDATTNFEGLSDLQQQYDVYGLPTMIFIDGAGKVLEDLTLTGFEKADPFLSRMQKAAPKDSPTP